MKNRIIVFILTMVAVAVFSTEKLSAQQITSELIYNGMSNVQTNGDVMNFLNVFAYKVTIPATNNPGNFKENNWSLVFRNINSNPFIDLSKVQFRISQVTGDATLPQIDGNRSPVQLRAYDVDIVDKSKFELINGKVRKEYIFHFDIIVNKKDFEVNEFGLSFDIALVRPNRSVITSQSSSQVFVPVDPMPKPDFGFEVNANATLDFNTPEQYTRQVENNPNDSWINVTSKNSGYVITVKTNNPNFELIRNDSGVSGDATIPVNVVNVEMQSAGSGASQGPKTLSSTIAQTLFIGTKNNNPQKLPVRYFITKTEAEKLAIKTSGEYRTILTYTLEPN